MCPAARSPPWSAPTAQAGPLCCARSPGRSRRAPGASRSRGLRPAAPRTPCPPVSRSCPPRLTSTLWEHGAHEHPPCRQRRAPPAAAGAVMSSVPLAQRAGGPDLARGLSLLGIALANMVGWLHGREWTVLLKQREGTGLDRTVDVLVAL